MVEVRTTTSQLSFVSMASEVMLINSERIFLSLVRMDMIHMRLICWVMDIGKKDDTHVLCVLLYEFMDEWID